MPLAQALDAVAPASCSGYPQPCLAGVWMSVWEQGTDCTKHPVFLSLSSQEDRIL